MRALLQRVKEAKVQVMGRTVGQIEKGLVVLLGVTHDDTKEDLDYLVEKTLNLRIFPDDKENEPILAGCGGRAISGLPVYSLWVLPERKEAQLY